MRKNSAARLEANNRWNAKNYDDIKLRVLKGERDRLKLYCIQQGISLNGFISGALSYCIANGIDVSNAAPLADVLPVSDGFPPDTDTDTENNT